MGRTVERTALLDAHRRIEHRINLGLPEVGEFGRKYSTKPPHGPVTALRSSQSRGRNLRMGCNLWSRS